jgi:NAD(P)-dependent dehydrogenase (short-subunit alcohol dehydrogenase family)
MAGDPEHIPAAAAFLASDDATFVTGAHPNLGQTMQRPLSPERYDAAVEQRSRARLRAV